MGSAQVTIDGTCAPSEWSDVTPFTFDDGGTAGAGSVSLKQDGSSLFICVIGKQGTLPDRFFRVYIDTNFGQETNAQSEDIGLEVDIEFFSGFNFSWRGNGSGGYQGAGNLPGWVAAVKTGPGFNLAGYQIALSLTGGTCGATFGIAVYHQWFANVGNDYGWPSNQWYYAPNTWTPAYVSGRSCIYIPTVTR